MERGNLFCLSIENSHSNIHTGLEINNFPNDKKQIPYVGICYSFCFFFRYLTVRLHTLTKNLYHLLK